MVVFEGSEFPNKFGKFLKIENSSTSTSASVQAADPSMSTACAHTAAVAATAGRPLRSLSPTVLKKGPIGPIGPNKGVNRDFNLKLFQTFSNFLGSFDLQQLPFRRL